MIARKEGWEKRFSKYLYDMQKEPFIWGQNDCLLFCAGAVESITGIDLAHEERGMYEDEAGAAAYGSVESILNTRLGLSIENIKTARRGDVVTVLSDGLECAGVADDSGQRIACMTLKGLCRLPLSSAIKLWRVG